MDQTKMEMNIFKPRLAAILMMATAATLAVAPCHDAAAQDQNVIMVKNLDFESRVHDFGTISEDSGEKRCTFKYKNNTDIPIVIQKVIVSCACTSVEWSDKPIKPGGTGVIKVLFSNQIGPGKFDKSVTVYTSSSPTRIPLRIRGVVAEASKKQK